MPLEVAPDAAAPSEPSLRSLGQGSRQAAPGDDARFATIPTLPINESDVTNLVADLAARLIAANNLSDLTNAGAARTNLGLGTLATQNGTFSGTSSGTNTGDQTITLTGDVTGSGTGSFAATIAALAVTDAKVAAANKDGAAGTASMRTLGTGATQAAAGNDSRLSDARTPTAHHTTHEPGGSDPMAVDAAAGTGSLRTLGTGATQATAGNDSRLSDARTATAHASTHNAGGSDALAIDAAAGTGSFRTLGTGATQACAGNDSRLSDARTPTAHASTHGDGGSDPTYIGWQRTPTVSLTVQAGYGVAVPGPYILSASIVLTLGSGSVLQVI